MYDNWLNLKDVLKVLALKQQWTPQNKYLTLRLDTRITENDFHCVVMDKSGKELTLEELENERGNYGK